MKMKKIVFASNNNGKIKEMEEILGDADIQILSASQAGITDEAEEDGPTFFDNAWKKVDFVNQRTGEWAVADDSGLCIEALNGAPGVLSARWAGEDKTDRDLVNYTLEKMKEVPDDQRRAWFESAVVLMAPDGRYWNFTGRIHGTITRSPQGDMRHHLPYDLIFIPDNYNITFAQMSGEEKNKLSHRGEAFRQIKEFIKNNT